MPRIRFIGISEDLAPQLVKLFEQMKSFKEVGIFDETTIWASMPRVVRDNFSRLDLGDKIDSRWDFGSWVDAIANCEIDFESIEVKPDGSGILCFDELSQPSGGVEATEQFVKVYGGEVVSNGAT